MDAQFHLEHYKARILAKRAHEVRYDPLDPYLQPFDRDDEARSQPRADPPFGIRAKTIG